MRRKENSWMSGEETDSRMKVAAKRKRGIAGGVEEERRGNGRPKVATTREVAVFAVVVVAA